MNILVLTKTSEEAARFRQVLPQGCYAASLFEALCGRGFHAVLILAELTSEERASEAFMAGLRGQANRWHCRLLPGADVDGFRWAVRELLGN